MKINFFRNASPAKEIYAFSVGGADYYVDLDNSMAPRDTRLWAAALVAPGQFYTGQEIVIVYHFYSFANFGIIAEKLCRLHNKSINNYTSLYISRDFLVNDRQGQAVYKILSSYQEYILSKPQRHQDEVLRAINERMKNIERKIEADNQKVRERQAQEEAELDAELNRLKATRN